MSLDIGVCKAKCQCYECVNSHKRIACNACKMFGQNPDERHIKYRCYCLLRRKGVERREKSS